MLVQCPNCLTHYRVADASVASSKPVFRCTRCKHVFSLGGAAEMPPVEEPAAPQGSEQAEGEAEGRELSFSFPPADEAKPVEAAGEKTTFSFPLEKEPASEEPEREKEPAEPVPAMAAEAPSPALPVHEEGLSTKPYLSLFGLLVLFYFLVTAFHTSHPERVESLLRQVPWLGTSAFRNNHLKQGVAVESLRPGYYRIVGNREVFVLSGVVVNQNSVSVREVRIEGAIYDGEGKEIERQTISIGNPISPRIIRDLTAQEVAILQKLNPQKGFEISPEHSREFAIIFLKPNGRNISGFACRVSSATGSV
jgi:predicted Zn finger-like uncharacterized protein